MKITAVFNLAFMLSVNLAPLMSVDSCKTSCSDDHSMMCCEMAQSNHHNSCGMSFNECTEKPLLPLVTAPINQVSFHIELVESLWSNSVDIDPNESVTGLYVDHYVLPAPPPSYTLPLLI